LEKLQMIYVLILVAVLVAVAYKKGLFDKKHEANQPVAPTPTVAGMYSGEIVLPEHEERLRAYAESRARGETNEGGGVDHGFYLQGSFSLTADAAGAMVGEFIIHGSVSKATGHINTDGTFGGGHEGGSFEGKVVNKQITGMIFEGGGREYLQITAPESEKVPFIFGRLSGGVQ
jgi:hypothetical protein